MKSAFLCAVALAIGGLAAGVLVPLAGARPAPDGETRVLLQHAVSPYAAARGRDDGAPGASAVGFRVSNAVQGCALIVGLDAPVLGVFVGLNAPNEHLQAPYEDLQVKFTLADGTSRTVKPAGGSGLGMLFHSPPDVPMTSLRSVELLVDDSAEWTK